MTKQLDEHATQFRVAQKRLLILFKDKTPTSLSNLDVLLDSSFKQASACDTLTVNDWRTTCRNSLLTDFCLERSSV